ncbi:MAG: trypsin-like serine protease [Myxococcales bacterium]|nr:trypsin-like serine protease [Myxococcales bacterium]
MRLALALLLSGCAGLEPEGEVGTSRSAIVGGTVDYADPEVFMLLQLYDNGTQSGCTGTLIGGRSIVTAAHCVDPRIGNASSMTIYAMNKTDVNQASSYDLIKLVETRMHPSWNPSVGLANDVAMGLLERSPGIAPKPWNTSSVSGFGGRPLRAVGYGSTGSSGSGAGTKRTVDLTFRQLSSTHIYLGDFQGKGVCHGDSGGPSFHTFADGVERIVGVHSFTTSQSCTDGADVRLDYYSYASFVSGWLQEKEAPTCAEDGRCKTGCTPIDQDCACAADGVCSGLCANVAKDPDCPRDCAKNGVCALETCPSPDEDCVPTGGTCTSELQCRTRKCISDPQHPTYYCSGTCQSNADCPSGMECPGAGSLCRFPQQPAAQPGQSCVIGQTYCASGTVCAGPQGATTCQRPCTVSSDCTGGSTCEGGASGVKYCRPVARPIVFLPRARSEGNLAPSCAATGGLPLAGALLLLLPALPRRGRGALPSRSRARPATRRNRATAAS